MFRLWSVVLGAVLCCSCGNPDIWVPTQRQIDDMSYDEAAHWLETNLPPLTAKVSPEETRGARDVTVGTCTLTYSRISTSSASLHDGPTMSLPITIYLTDVQLIRARSVRPDVASVEIQWVWVDGRDDEWRNLDRHLGVASTTLGFYDVQSAVDDADLVVAVLERIVEICRGY